MLRPLSILVLLTLAFTFSGCVQEAEKPATTAGNGTAATDTPAPAEAAVEVSFPKLNEIDYAVNYDDGFHSHGKGRFGGLLAILGSHQYHVEIIPETATGDVLGILYDDHFKPFKTETKEFTLSLKVNGEQKIYTLLVDHDGDEGKPATFKISDPELAKTLAMGWDGEARVMITVDDAPASGRLAPIKR